MKIFNLFSWSAVVFAGILMICGVVDHLGGGGVFGLKHSSTFFTMANTSSLIALVIKFFIGSQNQKTN
ncbi:MAG: hypothetical protein K8S16_03000 [Bacteroidales bacterium]|nr:hypothetical protein [Bacteroidales bacterium]